MEDKFKDFLQALDLIKRAPKDLADHGLIIKEDESDWSWSEIIDEVKKYKENIDYISYDLESYDEKIIENILESFNEGNWLFLDIKKDLNSPIINQLKQLLNNGEMREVKYQDKNIYSVKMPEACRIIVLADRDFVENKMEYKEFYSFFGPVLSLY